MTLPKGNYLKHATLGYEQVAADIIWLRTIQVVGEEVITPKGYDWVYHALDVVTTLDPKFAYAYQFGAVILSITGKQPGKGNLLLEKGIKENPEVWQLPFYLGFNHFFYFQNYKLAAKYMADASELPGHPEYLPRLAARLYVQAGDPDVALEFLYRVYRETNDVKVRSMLEKRIQDVTAERDIRILEQAVKEYKNRYTAYPEDLVDLVRKGLIRDIPKEPFGGRYYLNQADGTVYSTKLKERMKIYEGRENNK